MTTDNRTNEPNNDRAHMSVLADALEAATRVPVQGGPSNRENCPGSGGHAGCGAYCMVCDLEDGEPIADDREALMEAMKRGEKVRQAAWSAYRQEPDGEGTKPHSDNWYRAEALMAAGFSRATVPDAATAWHDESSAETAAVMNHELATTLRVQRDAALEMMNEHRCGEKNESLMEALAGARAERDTAVAAIDRVRALHPVAYSGNSRSRNAFCATCTTSWPCPTVAVLDGAPEPDDCENKEEHA